MRAQRADIEATDMKIDLAPYIQACAAARAALEKAQRLRSQRPELMRAAKSKLVDAECARDALRIRADAGDDVDFNKLAALDVAVQATQADVDSAIRSGHADNVAIEALRGRLSEAHAALDQAMRPRLDNAKAIAEAKYRSGLQLVRDAFAIISKCGDEMVAVRANVSDLSYGDQAFSRTAPSREIVDFLLEFDPAVRERDRALSAVIRS